MRMNNQITILFLLVTRFNTGLTPPEISWRLNREIIHVLVSIFLAGPDFYERPNMMEANNLRISLSLSLYGPLTTELQAGKAFVKWNIRYTVQDHCF